jgi:orotidine-5'-phosphate decarboxylase
LPGEFAAARDPLRPRTQRARALGDFLVEVIGLARHAVPAAKIQSAFFEMFGADGARQWERVVGAARTAGLLVIGDLKRGDIDSTAKAYASAYLDPSAEAPCDAITVNPYLGEDSIEPFLEACARWQTGLFVLVRTSNPGSAEFQNHGSPRLCELVADSVSRWGDRPELVGESGLSSVGAVIGATHERELALLRARMPRTPLLVPGYGAQGATAADLARAFARPSPDAPLAHPAVLVNASRSILYPWRGRTEPEDWRASVRQALSNTASELAAALSSSALRP